ncbi:MAG: guanylate kinase [Bacteroidetes bacterium RIFCSPHIGHO2_02_FULL_44_7]|nr:MAG: guanylate kinase [Bacteroidetes bacterium RIFCSPHIGHO2_02_FULL_44_7]
MRSDEQGKCVIFSAPSGAGKTTIVHYLLSRLSGLEFSVSACSREPRVNEVHGKDYYFLGLEGFRKKIAEQAFVEWEEVYTDNYYGTLKSEIERIWSQGNSVIFDVDVVGGLNLKKKFGDAALAVFVQPPSIDVLEKRLRGRSTESEDKIRQRMEKAANELSYADRFDVLLVNDDLDAACQKALILVTEFLGRR